MGLDPWGHSLARPVKDLPGEEVNRLRPLLPLALALDTLYIPTRYPDTLPGLIPREAYTREEAEEALAQAQLLLTQILEALGED